MGLNRRNFIRLSGAGIAGGIAISNINNAGASQVTKNTKLPGKIIYRTLGRTGLKVPIVSLGAMRVDNPNLVKTAYESGITFFDTAQSYGQGRNEELLGNILKDYKRDSFILATKIGLRQQLISADELMAKVDESLSRLQMSYIDILYLHGVDNKDYILNPELISLLENVKKTGKVKFVGLSTHRNMVEVLRAAVEGKVYDVVLTSYNFKLKELTDLQNAVNEAANAGLGIVAMKTMAGAFWDKEKTKKINTKAALKYALLNENIHTAIPGCISFDQLEDNLSIMADLQLTEQEKLDLAGDGQTSGIFCLGCENCVSQCPYNVQIPDLMRSYMYAYGYQSTKLAREVIDLQPGNNTCELCPVCNVKCKAGFNVKEKIADVYRIKNIPVEFLS